MGKFLINRAGKKGVHRQKQKYELVAQRLKHLPPMQETWVQSLGREDHLEKEMQPTPVFLPGESHGQRSLVGYSSRGHKELDTTERLHQFFVVAPRFFDLHYCK